MEDNTRPVPSSSIFLSDLVCSRRCALPGHLWLKKLSKALLWKGLSPWPIDTVMLGHLGEDEVVSSLYPAWGKVRAQGAISTLQALIE